MKIIYFIKNIRVLRIISDVSLTACINFFLLSFFTFLGTDIPFQERLKDAYEAETTNLINQVVYIFLFFSSFYVSIHIYNSILRIVRKEKLLSIFILLCVISFSWSDYSLISFKRSFQLLVTFITILNIVILVDERKHLKLLIFPAIIYLIVNYFSGLFIPAAIDPSFGTWRGIELHKNLLGYSALMISIIALWLIVKNGFGFRKLCGLILLIFSTGLIILSFSTTNIFAVFSILLLYLLLKITSIFNRLGIKIFIFILSLFVILAFAIIFSIYSKEVLSEIPALFGKDTSLTGRDVIWIYIWNEILKRPLLGYGYGTYWIMGTHIIDLFSSFVGWRVNEAHNGFLEIALQLGIVGFAIFILTYFLFIIKALKQENILAIIVILAITLVNFSESFIFTPRDPSTLLFILFYFNLVKQDLNLNTNVFS